MGIEPCDFGIKILKYPYPYKAMLAICSDLDETPDERVYFETLRYLNTEQQTSIGKGVSLEIGNSIYFNMPSDQFSYWNTSDRGRTKIQECIRSGHIDVLHSFGDLSNTRKHVEKAINELIRNNCKLEVWVDHAVAPTNFDSGIMKGSGDIPGSEAYHADLTIDYGIKYLWKGRVTSVIGQNAPLSYKGLYSYDNLYQSVVTITKDLAKSILGSNGYTKYSMHSGNKLLRKIVMRDGQRAFEFIRCNPNWKGVSEFETADGIGKVIKEKILNRLVERQSICILYTHLGKITNKEKIFSIETRKAFNRLSEFQRDGKLLVATTRRLLGYCRMINEVNVSLKIVERVLIINVKYTGPYNDLNGLSLMINENFEKIVMKINNKLAEGVDKLVLDKKNIVIKIPWNKLYYPI